jgi:glycosyltransferase involved in cell wall biosynthesis
VKKSICLVTSVTFFVEVFLLHQIEELSRRYDVTVLVNSDEHDFFTKRGIQARIVRTPIERKIHLFRDLRALLALMRFFRANSFDIVHSTTPKAGLLSTIAGAIARVPVRIHTFTGQVWGSRTGSMYRILKTADKLTALFATHILVDSFSQRKFLIEEGIVSQHKSRVLANGSISGVNIERYRPNEQSRAEIRLMYAIPADALVFLYMARLTRDKGALMMAEGFATFARDNACDAHLLVVGPDEEDLRPRIARICGQFTNNVHFVDYTRVPEKFMAAADIFCLPSYREGFGSVLINAAATGIPAIASRIYGSEEAIQENITGLLHEAGNVGELSEKMRSLASDPPLRAALGQNGQVRARRDFSETAVTVAILEFYQQVMSGETAQGKSSAGPGQSI